MKLYRISKMSPHMTGSFQEFALEPGLIFHPCG
jgi:hypothetical protein